MSSISEPLEPEDDTLIWSEWVFLLELSPADSNEESFLVIRRCPQELGELGHGSTGGSSLRDNS